MVCSETEAETKQPLEVRLWRVCRGRKERGMWEEKHQRTWETQLFPARAGKWSRPKEGELKSGWESDQLIVLRERESRLQGEGAEVDT